MEKNVLIKKEEKGKGKGNRSKVLRDGLLVFLNLIDGNSHTIKGLSHLEIHPKTLGRILKTLETIDIAKVRSYKVPDQHLSKWICRIDIKEIKKVEFKECYKCLQRLGAEKHFYKNRRSIDGYQDTCKKCFLRGQHIYYDKNKIIINRRKRLRHKRNRALFIRGQIT